MKKLSTQVMLELVDKIGDLSYALKVYWIKGLYEKFRKLEEYDYDIIYNAFNNRYHHETQARFFMVRFMYFSIQETK